VSKAINDNRQNSFYSCIFKSRVNITIFEALASSRLAREKKVTTPRENTQREIYVYTEINYKSMIRDFLRALEKYETD